MRATAPITRPVMNQMEGHRLLARLPLQDRRRIAQKMHVVCVDQESVRYESTGVIEDVFFPLSAVFSLSGTTSEGHMVEIGQIGCEGIAGVEVALRTPLCGQRLVSTGVEIAGTALRMNAGHFAEEVDQYSTVNRCVRRYMGFFFSQLQRSIACNRHHSLEQRCARRLLTAQDLSGEQDVHMTQHQLAHMLGASRQSVDRVLQILAEQAIVHLRRGTVRIEDRLRLKRLACGCYRLLRRELNEFLK